MRIQLRESIYTAVFGGTKTKSCEGCTFFSWDEGICTASILIYRLCCPPSGKVLQCTDKYPEVFDL